MIPLIALSLGSSEAFFADCSTALKEAYQNNPNIKTKEAVRAIGDETRTTLLRRTSSSSVLKQSAW